MKRIAKVLLIAGVLFLAAVYALGYHGARSFGSRLSSLPDPAEVVQLARSLSGTPYDPLMGTYGNIGAKAGFIVCSDVPNLAYGEAGYSLQAMLEADFKAHPNAYNTANGNEPGNPYFHRRARNLFAYFNANKRILPPDSKPHVGDLAFYHQNPGTYASHVALVTAVDGDSYRVMESAPETIVAQEVEGSSPRNRGWKLMGFGRMYPEQPLQTTRP